MKPLLQILNSPDPGGVLALSDSITAHLERHGFSTETVFLTPRPGLSARAKLAGALVAARRIASGEHQAVIAYQAWPSIIVGVASLFAPRTRTLVHQTTVPSATWGPIRWLGAMLGALGRFPVNIVNTAFTRSQFDAYSKAYRRHLRLIEHGVEPPVISRSRAETLARHGIPGDRRILVNTARLVEEKNQATLIRTLPRLPDCRLIVAGEGATRAELEGLAIELGIADRVHLLGALSHQEAIELYGIADLFVFPSLHETFGISAVEAALLSIPTIVSDITVLREVLTIDERSPVAFIDATDVEGWTEQIAAWTRTPPDQAERRSFAAALASRYSEERMMDAYLELLSAPTRIR